MKKYLLSSLVVLVFIGASIILNDKKPQQDIRDDISINGSHKLAHCVPFPECWDGVGLDENEKVEYFKLIKEVEQAEDA